MSERMTDVGVVNDMVTVRQGLLDGGTFGAGDPEHVALTRLAEEIQRARTEEERKDAVIRALADALERRCAEHRDACMCGGCHALRLAGRLK